LSFPLLQALFAATAQSALHQKLACPMSETQATNMPVPLSPMLLCAEILVFLAQTITFATMQITLATLQKAMLL